MKVAIRADAYALLGTGHVMRCIALGQGIRDGSGEVVFVTYCESEGLLARLRKEDFLIYQLQAPGSYKESLEIIEIEKPDWVVLDGYHFDTEFQKAVKDAGYRLLYIDDYAHLDHYYADIILNQNYGADKFWYVADPGTRILTGTRYCLLRREFLEYADFKREIPDIARKILITMGGSDSENHALKVLKAINLIDNPLDVKVVIGAGNPHYESIAREITQGKHNVEIQISVENMAPLMAWADIAFSAGGTTVWELANMGLPSILCVVAANQEGAVTYLHKTGIFHSLGWIKDRTAAEISECGAKVIFDRLMRDDMTFKGKQLVDGKGTRRISTMLKDWMIPFISQLGILRDNTCIGEAKLVNFLNITSEEQNLILEKRNSNNIGKWMFSAHIISSEEHTHFLQRLKQDNENFYWLVKEGDLPIGVVSAQKVDVVLGEGFLGIYAFKKGIGAKLLQIFLNFWFASLGMKSLVAEALADNERALQLYKEHGFREMNSTRHIVRSDGKSKVVSLSLDTDGYSEVKKSYAA